MRREDLKRCLIIEFGNLDVRGELIDPVSVRGIGKSLDRTFL